MGSSCLIGLGFTFAKMKTFSEVCCTANESTSHISSHLKMVKMVNLTLFVFTTIERKRKIIC